MNSLSQIIFSLLVLLVSAQARADDLPVDLELVLAVDVSGSMDFDEQRLQRAGYVQALTHDQVLNAILSGPYQRVAIAYVEWAGPSAQSMAVPWRLIDGRPAAEEFARELSRVPFARIRHTSIGAALLFASTLFAQNGFAADRQVIDVSGDGPNNAGPPVVPVRDELADQGIIVNGLPIMLKDSNLNTVTGFDLDVYYEDCVITGPGAFVVPVLDLGQFGDAIRQKLTLEIAWSAPSKAMPVAAYQADPRLDCGIGEKMRQNWYRDP